MDARFLAAAPSLDHLPAPSLNEVAVVGLSNCGKSSLINAVTGKSKLARTSSTPGRTRQIVFFVVEPDAGEPFHLVDLPGYGYARVSKSEQRGWATLVNGYIEHRPTLRGMLLLCDIRRELAQEEHDLMRWAGSRGLQVQLVLTKADKLNKTQRFAAARRSQGLQPPPAVVSVHEAESVARVREALLRMP